MNDIWENVWQQLSETFQMIASSLSSEFPEMTWSSGHSDNKAFPFRVYAAFNHKRRSAEDVVASIDFHRSSDGELRYSADIGFDDGQVLADGPNGIIKVSAGLAGARTEIEAAIMDVVAFLNTSVPALRSAMERRL